MAKKKPSKTASEGPSFEEALARLDEIVERLEGGVGTLEESLAGYEEGVGLLRRCHGMLEVAEQKIELLTSVDEDGRATTEPLAATEGDLEQKMQGRDRRRSHGAGSNDSAEVDPPGSLF